MVIAAFVVQATRSFQTVTLGEHRDGWRLFSACRRQFLWKGFSSAGIIATIPRLTYALEEEPSEEHAPSPVIFATVDDIPKEYFREHRTIYAYVERIIDGDTFRARHIPGYEPGVTYRPKPLQTQAIANLTLKLRLYAVDTPEIAKSKSQVSQLFAPEAKEETQRLIYHDVVAVTLLRKDQYSRAICRVQTANGKDVSKILLEKGLAELYTGGGAEYGGEKEVFEGIQAVAKSRKIGIWSLGTDMVTAKEAKACVRGGGETNLCYQEGLSSLSKI